MKGLFLLATISLTAAKKLRTEEYTFESFMKEFGKTYSFEERPVRQRLFEDKLAEIIAHNANPSSTYRKGVNQFTDRSAEELAGVVHGLNRPLLHSTVASSSHRSALHAKHATSIADELDWRSKDVVTPVKNQGQCGSCWAFASAETVESHWAIVTGNLMELSEQFILDCTPNLRHCGGMGGCFGGTGELAMTRLKDLGGIPSEWTYPYLSGHNGTASVCHGLPLTPEVPHSGAIMAAAVVTDVKSTETNDYDSMMDALQLGPLAVSVDAGAWHDYESGIFDGGNMTNPTLNHLVQLVGYGSDADGSYWIVRNSWTPLWGEHGFIRLKRFGSGAEPCGIDLNPADGNGCDDGPPTVKVCGQSGVLYDGVYPIVTA